MMTQHKTCPTCSGTGKIIDPRDEGADWRKKRKKSGLSQKDVAKKMKVSATFLSDLELGRRTWNDKHRTSFLKAISE